MCSEADVSESIYSCDSPVVTGKTTAIMVNLLKAAIEKKLRRIFVILPYTNIIDQSVQIYRNALTLPGENPEEIVSALHHRTEYDEENARQFSILWNAPVIVTTAVQFFETLAAATPSALRKLHNLPGSAIFIDESHAALPAKLWVQAWKWIKTYSEYWGCHFVLASGSLIRFWEIEEFDKDKMQIPEILPDSFRHEISEQEIQRVAFKFKKEKMNEHELCDWLVTLSGPRLLIVNTVQSAAVIAKKLKSIYGKEAVEHISTALTPKDREKLLEKVKLRLKSKDDSDWTLVATSCVEAGVDFSFRTGIREAASLVSLLQTAGRIRRNSESDYYDAAVWTIELKYDGLLIQHPTFSDSAKVLLKLAGTEEISPSLCTKAFLMELKEGLSFREKISHAEQKLGFETVEKEFKVIDSETVSVLIDKELVERVKNYEAVSWKEIQNSSVQIWSNKIDKNKLKLEEIRPEIFAWSYDYDNELIGYMAGILDIEELSKEGYAIL
jgi:CRISPR-associated endonuclease/helicase Cas3